MVSIVYQDKQANACSPTSSVGLAQAPIYTHLARPHLMYVTINEPHLTVGREAWM